jgi:uncharacterized membrane protein YhaH (DUF805 family)
MYCPNCGAETESGGQFCGSCGANLETGENLYGTPLPRVGFVDAIKLGFSNYFKFSGRSRRSEFWFWVLFALLGSIVFQIVDLIVGVSVFDSIFGLVILIPGLALAARRLHDIGKSGWWQLLYFAVIIGWIILIIWQVRDGDQEPNAHGQNPKYGS